ncbi:MAG: response regulator, partial [Gammaproteobacteria bacterium]|nr:response regulator [Gammaproteobacteria bacterium]MBT4549136.1 response regulator [Gammaproteobacteria bacterium]
MNALVIDDVPVQNILRKMLLESGVDEVKTASTGSEGLRYLSQGEIDLLILDIHLP